MPLGEWTRALIAALMIILVALIVVLLYILSGKIARADKLIPYCVAGIIITILLLIWLL